MSLNVAKCNLGEVKLEQVGLRSSPIAVCDTRELQDVFGGFVALLADHSGSTVPFCELLQILAPSHPSLPGDWWFQK